jgi:hypothetical protein
MKNTAMNTTLQLRSLSLPLAVLLIACGCAPPENPGSSGTASNATSGAAATSPAVAPGDIDLSKLPVPTGVKPVYVGPDVAMYQTAAAADATREECRKLLTAQGWEPYGSAGDVNFYKQKLVRLTASVSVAPAQGNQTMISYSREQMHADLPAPANAKSMQYADTTKTVHFDVPEAPDAIAAFYRTKLESQGWKATTENLIKDDFKSFMIFRNEPKDMLTLELRKVEDFSRGSLQFMTAAEVAEMDRRLDEQRAKREAEKKAAAEKPLPKITIAVPADAKDVKKSAAEIEFQLEPGRAQAVAEGWRKTFLAEGYKEENAGQVKDKFGLVSFEKDEQRLTISYTDTGVVPAEIELRARGVELVAETAKLARPR